MPELSGLANRSTSSEQYIHKVSKLTNKNIKLIIIPIYKIYKTNNKVVQEGWETLKYNEEKEKNWRKKKKLDQIFF